MSESGGQSLLIVPELILIGNYYVNVCETMRLFWNYRLTKLSRDLKEDGKMRRCHFRSILTLATFFLEVFLKKNSYDVIIANG